MGYDLIPKKEGVEAKSGMIFTWPIILDKTGAGYLFGYGINTFDTGKYIYDASRSDGSPVSNDGFDVPKEDALIMARLFRGYVSVKRELREEWDKIPVEKQVMLESIYGKGTVPPSVEFLQKVEALADFFEQSEGFNIL